MNRFYYLKAGIDYSITGPEYGVQIGGVLDNFPLLGKNSLEEIQHTEMWDNQFSDFNGVLDAFLLDHSDVKLTDMLSYSRISSYRCFIINEHLKNMLFDFRLPFNRIIPAVVATYLNRDDDDFRYKKLVDAYYLFQYLGEYSDEVIDYHKTPKDAVDYPTIASPTDKQGKHIWKEEMLQSEFLELVLKQMNGEIESWISPEHVFYFKKGFRPEWDLFLMKPKDNYPCTVISERLARRLLEEKITGVNIWELPFRLQD